MEVDIAVLLKQYPPSRICDEFPTCADYADRHAQDLCCESCDIYLELVRLEQGRE